MPAAVLLPWLLLANPGVGTGVGPSFGAPPANAAVPAVLTFSAMLDGDTGAILSGIDNLTDNPNLTVNGSTVAPTFIYRMVDADITQITEFSGNGFAIPVSSSGTDPTFNVEGPFQDANSKAVKFGGGEFYEYTEDSTYGDIDNEDAIFEIIVKGDEITGNAVLMEKVQNSVAGWRLTRNGTGIGLLIYDNGFVLTTATLGMIDTDRWYHALFFMDFDETEPLDSLNGIASQNAGTAANGGTSVSLSNSNNLSIGAEEDTTNRWDGTVMYLAMYTKDNWFAGTPTNRTDWNALSRERTARLMGVHPDTAGTTETPALMERNSHGRVYRYISGALEMFEVHDDLARMVEFKDSADVTVSGYLHEQAATNRILQSENLQTSWTTSNTTITQDVVDGPVEASATCDAIAEDGANSTHFIQQTFTQTGSGQVCMSTWAKAANRSWMWLQGLSPTNSCYFNLSTGAVSTCTGGVDVEVSEDWGGGWYRVGICYTSNNTSGTFYIGAASGDGGSTFQGATQDSIYICGTQQEDGPEYPTSYLETTTTSVSRTIDEMYYEGSDGSWDCTGATGCTVEAHVLVPSYTPTIEKAIFEGSDGGSCNDRDLFYINASDVPLAYGRESSDQWAITGTSDFSSATLTKIARYASPTSVLLYVDGSTEGTEDTSANMVETVDRIYVGSGEHTCSLATSLNGIITNVKVYTGEQAQ